MKTMKYIGNTFPSNTNKLVEILGERIDKYHVRVKEEGIEIDGSVWGLAFMAGADELEEVAE